MADLSLDCERALILAGEPLGQLTFDLLNKAGIEALAAATLEELGAALDHGAGLAIVDEQTLESSNLSPLQRYFDRQPDWSNLPVVLLTHTHKGRAAPRARTIDLGNFFELQCPFDPASLLALAHSSLRARRRQYQIRNQDQARKMEAIGQLAGSVAHDFNNLLTGIGGSLELIDKRLKQGRTETLPGLLELSRNAVKRAASMTHNLLAFASRQSLDSRPVQLRELLCAAQLEPLLDPQVNLKVETASGLWPAHVDPQQLQEAVGNLLRNACEAMPDGGRLTIKASNQHLEANHFGRHALPTGDYVRLSIVDTGCGMAQSTLERAFDPFYTTKPVGQGTGLGLSMVYGFSNQSGGHVTLNSQLGQGTRVDIYLPRCNDQMPGKATSS
ncbi:sensor histidine kinase [Pseudomonas sp. BJa5]|uniref:sensor histidine kinase n=1 Tax=Pseudomonas sp. BJa5 TaxID=2936270 RepID=UPI0025599AF3|nr:ATP-binding protein [Pseudomonas sp. BGr12]MDL2422621.1 ATP-binding protein [Pseudomonas sp. BGr12]